MKSKYHFDSCRSTRLFLFLTAILLFSSEFLQAQFPFFIHYSVDNGLPATEILDMHQDENGYIWFSSAYGLSRFNGTEFMEFTTSDGLPSLSFTKAFTSPSGQIWFGSYEGFLCYSEKGKIKSLPVNKELGINLKHSPILNMVWTPDGSILVKSAKNPLNIRIKPDGKLEEWGEYVVNNKNSKDFFLVPLDNQLIWGLTNENSQKKGKEDKAEPSSEIIDTSGICYFNFRDDLKIVIPGKKADYSVILKHYTSKNNTRYVAFDRKLYILSAKHLLQVKEFPGVINAIFCDTKGSMWISIANQGVWHFKEEDLKTEPHKYLNGLTITGIIQDHQGSYWFSSLEDGVYFVPGFGFINYASYDPLLSEPVRSLTVTGNTLLVSTEKKHTFSFQTGPEGKISSAGIKIIPLHEVVNEILNEGTYFWIPGSQSLRYTTTFKPSPPDQMEPAYQYSVCSPQAGQVWVLSDKFFFHYSNGTLDQNIFEFPQGLHPRVCISDNSGKIWLGTFQGLFSFDTYCISHIRSHPFLSSRISAISCSNSNMFLGSRTDGVLFIRNKEHTQFTVNDGLLSNSINTLLPQGDNAVWAGTNKGLNYIFLHPEDQEKPIIRSFTLWEGLPAGEIRKIAAIHGRIWLGTSKGIVSFFPDSLQWNPSFPPKLALEKILMNDSILVPENSSKFEPSQNTFTFYYQGISFIHPDKLLYHYKLVGSDTNWVFTTNSSVRFPKLAPGNYTFIIQASVNGSEWSSPPMTYSFSVRKPFSATITFIILMIISGLLIITLGFLLILRNQRKKAATKRAVLLSEIKALRSQMNPHFIFNSLNSIQYFILDKSVEHANIYLSGFAKLIRRILEQSKLNLIPLAEELVTIRLYLELEKLRFEKAFQYIEIIDSEVDTEEVRIPPMLIQPFLENSIWHGLMPKTGERTLTLHIAKESSVNLLITIKDNGVGRSGLDPLNRHPGHTPTGMKNIEERINLFNEINRSNLNLEIIDLFSEGHQPEGTIVILRLPLEVVA